MKRRLFYIIILLIITNLTHTNFNFGTEMTCRCKYHVINVEFIYYQSLCVCVEHLHTLNLSFFLFRGMKMIVSQSCKYHCVFSCSNVGLVVEFMEDLCNSQSVFVADYFYCFDHFYGDAHSFYFIHYLYVELLLLMCIQMCFFFRTAHFNSFYFESYVLIIYHKR